MQAPSGVRSSSSGVDIDHDQTRKDDPFSALPDAVVARVLALVGALEALELRAVCRQWRRAFDGAVWELLFVEVQDPWGLRELAWRIQSGRIRLARRLSVILQLTMTIPDPAVPLEDQIKTVQSYS
eukprot:tig00000940_g5548.t1